MRTRIPHLDGLRGIAVLLVILLHAFEKYPSLPFLGLFRHGWMGVDLFFALSGFLITDILIRGKRSDHFIRNFYIRRCLRIWPLYYALLLFFFVLVPVLRPAEAAIIFNKRSSPWWAYPIFLQNFLVPVPTMATGSLGVSWSLAVEELFYLIWPWIVQRCPLRQLRWISLAVVCLSPILRLGLSFQHVNVYTNPFCRLDGLMAGAFLALTLNERVPASQKSLQFAWCALAVTLSAAVSLDGHAGQWFVLWLTALAAASALYLALFSRSRVLNAILSNRSLTYTGTISYGLYLLHKIPFDVAQSAHLDRFPKLALAFGLVTSYGLAALSRRFFEAPFLALKNCFPETSASSKHLRIGVPAYRK